MMAENEEHRIGLVALSEQVKALVRAHEDTQGMIRELIKQIPELAKQIVEQERRTTESCKGCAVWVRLTAVEKDVASIVGRAAGMSVGAGIVTSALVFLATWFTKKP